MERYERVSIVGSRCASPGGAKCARYGRLSRSKTYVTCRRQWVTGKLGGWRIPDYAPCIYCTYPATEDSGGWRSDGDGDPGAPVFRVLRARERESPWNITSERAALPTRYHPRVRDLIADPRSRQRRGRGTGKGGTRGETDRHGMTSRALRRARSRGPGGPREVHVGPTCSLRERANARGVRGTREIYSRGNAIDAESPANGRRAKTEPTEEEKPGTPRSAAATTATATSPPATRRAENIRGEWRTLPARRGAAEDGGHRRSSAQERNLTPHTKPNAHRNARFKHLVRYFSLGGGKQEYCEHGVL